MSQPKQVENRIRVSQQFKDHIYAHCGDMQPGEWLEKQVKQAERRDKKIEELEIENARLKSQSVPAGNQMNDASAVKAPEQSHGGQLSTPATPDPPTLPFGASPISPLALTDTSTNMTHGNAAGTQSSPQENEYQSRLDRIKELAQLKEDHIRKVEAIKTQAVRQREEYKSEGDRQRHWKPARQQIQHDEPTLALKGPCPLGRTSTFCISNPCDQRGNCEAKPNDCRITAEMRGAEMSYVQ